MIVSELQQLVINGYYYSYTFSLVLMDVTADPLVAVGPAG